MRLWVLSNILLNHHYKEGGDSKALERAALLGEQALQITPETPVTVQRHALLFAQAVILYHKFERFPDLGHLDQSITLASEAIDIAPKTLTARRIFLNVLATGLQRRYAALFVQNDVERAIDAYDAILNITDDNHPSLPGYLNNLGMALLDRYCLLGEMADLERSITVREKMLLVTPDEHPAKPMFINTFCRALLERHKALGSKEDLDRCIELQEIVVAITPDSHYGKSDMVELLGAAYTSRFEIDKNLSDLDQAIDLFTEKATLTGAQDVSQGAAEFCLAEVFLSRFHHTGEVSDMHRALELFEVCTTLLCSPWNRFVAAMRWAVMASELAKVDLQECAASQFKACTAAMDLLPQLSWLGSPIETRREVLKRAQNITTIAVSRAILVEEYSTALAWVEQGRSVMWAQLLQLRVPVDDLRLVDPSLAQKLSYLAEQLSLNSTKAGVLVTKGDAVTSGYSDLEAEGTRHRQLVAEWTDTVEQVRRLDGFSRFLQPKNAEELCVAAHSGPVVIVHVNEYDADAFILVPGERQQIVLSLGEFTSDDVYRLRGLLAQVTEEDLAYRAPSSSRAAFPGPFEDLEPYEIFESILSELWYKIVSPVLQALAYNVPDGAVKSRIHWCPTGPLALLPLHAAGDYSKIEPGFKVFEYVVSSYTPTLSALIPPSKTEDPPDDDVTLLAVAVSSPTGQYPIPGTHEEIESISNRFSEIQKQERFAALTESAATPDRVLAGMKKANWVHFACHGVQNLVSPTDSALLLSGTSQLKLSDIVETSLPSAELAFLSACQTAAGDKDLPEESVHLAAGMLLAGYKGVIATMWSIMDRDAPAVSDDVYRYLLRDATRRPDYREAAYALHHAVARLREKHGTRSYLSWVPFVHFGM
ncbi:CHAT domain-containing protein [Mucidula mucida]|nr:CHAT domain-containing protein [Mucidula mucida]